MALKASRIAPIPKPSTMFGGGRSTNCRSTSAMTSSSREKASMAAASCRLSFATDWLGAALAGQEIAAVGRGQKILRAALDDAQAVFGELQVGCDLRVEQADGIGGHRIAETGMEFLGHGGAADHLAALDHSYAQAGHREIGGAGEAVMPRPDDDDVRLVHASFSFKKV